MKSHLKNKTPKKHSRNLVINNLHSCKTGNNIKLKNQNTINFIKNTIDLQKIINKKLFNNVNKINNNIIKKNTSKKNYNIIIYKNLNKYSSKDNQYNIKLINDLIESKNCHLVAVFKDYLINDYIDEFLKRIYKKNESFERLPKFSNYYKNYLNFFCKPTFSDFYANSIVQNFGELKAEIYYNENYGTKKERKKQNELKNIFNDSVKKVIEHIKNIDENNILYKNKKIDKKTFYFDSFEGDSTISNNNENSHNSTINKITNENSINSLINLIKKQNKNENNKKKANNAQQIKQKPIDNSNLNKNQNDNININNKPNKINVNKKIESISQSTRLNLNLNNTKHLKGNFEILNLIKKNKSKDLSNSKILITQNSNSNTNLIRNNLKLKNNQKYKTINVSNNKCKIIHPFNNNMKKKKKESISFSNSKNKKSININNHNYKIKNIKINDLMKLTLQIYNNKNNHQHTLSSPTINNFNININNNFTFNNNSKTRNKKNGLFRVNTELINNNLNNNNYLTNNIQNTGSNTLRNNYMTTNNVSSRYGKIHIKKNSLNFSPLTTRNKVSINFPPNNILNKNKK